MCCNTYGGIKVAKNKFYVTAPLYYVNDVPHLGHAYTTIAADILARWNRAQGKSVFFITGTDEHGLKIQRAAEQAGKKPKKFVDDMSKKWKDVIGKLNISYDSWIRTTDPAHEKAVQEFIQTVAKKKDIREGKYKGNYCVDCEHYLIDDDIIDGKCKIHKKPVEFLEEDTYFFKMSKYAGKLAELYKKKPELIQPKGKVEEIRGRILREGLQDLSITRTTFDWGVPFPLDKKHVTYVWFDALTNYISALGWPDGKKFKEFWPADLHLIGKDILWFHTAMWHSMLLSAGIELPKTVYAHGWWTVEGEKMSKSLGNVIDPVKMVDKYGVDSFRYYLFREVPFGEDGNFSEKVLVQRHNTELANELGNLVSRTLTLIEKFSRGKVPEPKRRKSEDVDFIATLDDDLRHTSGHVEKLEFHRALGKIWEFIKAVNKYIDSEKPWELAKKKDKHLATVLYNCAEALRLISALIGPFMPETAGKIAKQVGVGKVPQLAGLEWGQLKPGTSIKKGKILFEKVEEPGEMRPPRAPEGLDVGVFHMRVGTIVEVQDFKEAKKPLYKVKVDFGYLGQKWTAAGLRNQVKKAALKGKKVIGLLNLEPKAIAGFKSHFLLLAGVDKEGHIEVLTAKKSKPGDRVYFEGEKSKPAKQVTIEEFLKLALKPDKHGRILHYKKPMRTDKEEIRLAIIRHGIIR